MPLQDTLFKMLSGPSNLVEKENGARINDGHHNK